MHADVACLLCTIDPGAVNMVVPVAQATIIAVPIVLRDQIRQGVRAARARYTARRAMRDQVSDAADGPDEVGSDEVGPPA